MLKKWPKLAPQNVLANLVRFAIATSSFQYALFFFFYMYYLWEKSWHKHWRKRHWVYPAADFFWGGGAINASGIFDIQPDQQDNPRRRGKRSWTGAMLTREIREHVFTKTCLHYSISDRAWWVELSPEPRQCMTSAGRGEAVHRGGAKLNPFYILLHMFPVGRGTANLSVFYK